MSVLLRPLMVQVSRRLVARHRRLQARPEEGSETVDKLLWATGTVVIAGGAAGYFRDEILDAVQGLVVSLGW